MRRLPVIQSSSLALMSPAVANLKFDIQPCPENSTPSNDLWVSRMLQVGKKCLATIL